MFGKVSNSFLWYFIKSGSSNILKNKGHMTGHRPHITILLTAWQTQHVLLCPVLPCPALPCPALPCPALPCSDLPCSALHCSALPCPPLPFRFNIFSANYDHATWTAHISTFTLQIHTMLHGEPTFLHFFFRFWPWYRNSLLFNIYSADSYHATWTV